MTGATFVVSFESGHPPIRLAAGARLLDHLDIENSPVLFGCRTGICGTCAVRVATLQGELVPPETEEAELLALVCPGDASARLTCQLSLTADVRLATLMAPSPGRSAAPGSSG
jgi:ferredoxin